jgi:MFS family permease
MNRGIKPESPRSLVGVMTLQFAIGGAVLPFISLYLRDKGLDFPQIGRIFAISASLLLVFPFLWGMMADRLIPLNRLFIGLNLAAAGALIGLARVDSYMGLLVTYALLHAVLNPTFMLINALCFPHLGNPSEEFGRLRAWGSLGWILPSLPIFFWLAFAKQGDLRFVMEFGWVLALAAMGAAWFVPHTAPGAHRPRADGTRSLEYWRATRLLMRNPNYLALLVSFFLVAASFSIYAYYSSPHLEDLGMHRAWIGPVQSVGVILEIVLFRWRTRLIGSAGYATPILGGCAALVLRHLLFAWCGHLAILTASYLLVGVVVVFYHIGVSILVDRIAPPEVRSTAQTLLVLCGSGLGPMFANWSAGRLTAALGPGLQPVFLFAGLLAFLAGVVIWVRRQQLAVVEQGVYGTN